MFSVFIGVLVSIIILNHPNNPSLLKTYKQCKRKFLNNFKNIEFKIITNTNWWSIVLTFK